MKTKLPSTREYAQFVTELKQRIASARLHAAVSCAMLAMTEQTRKEFKGTSNE